MTNGKLAYHGAVYILDKFMKSKSTHGVNSIINVMQSICLRDFVTPIDHNDFANLCSNFDKYVRETGKTSMGRNQFEKWWNIQDTGEARDFEDELQEDPLSEEFSLYANNDPRKPNNPCTKAHVWKADECPHCRMQELENENMELRKRLHDMIQKNKRRKELEKELAEWDLNN